MDIILSNYIAIYGAIKYFSNLNYNIWDYGWGFINVTERNHWMTLNTAFIHT